MFLKEHLKYLTKEELLNQAENFLHGRNASFQINLPDEGTNGAFS